MRRLVGLLWTAVYVAVVAVSLWRRLRAAQDR